MTATAYLNQTVLYGGLPVRRIDMERHLDDMGVTGPARLAYERSEVVDVEPVERWNGESWVSAA